MSSRNDKKKQIGSGERNRFRVSTSSRLMAQGMNLTQREPKSRHTNLLKEFQECITDQEAYPTAELTCSEYGTFLHTFMLYEKITRRVFFVFKVQT